MSYAIAAGLAVASLTTTASAADITGAGATFPFPVYSKWAEAYKKETGNGMNYQSIGSGGGIKQIQAKTVDFGATDAPLKGEELEKDGLVQFPTVMGGVVAGRQHPGRRRRPAQADRRGPRRHLQRQDRQVERSEDRAAQPGREAPQRQHHPGLPLGRLGHDQRLHHLPVAGRPRAGRAASAPAPRSSGRSARAARATRAWPRTVKQVPNSIGYVEYAYAKQNSIPFALLQNKAGKFARRRPRRSRPLRPTPIGSRLPASASR